MANNLELSAGGRDSGRKFTDTKEFYDLVESFERNHRHLLLDREPKDLYRLGRYYQSGETNVRFVAFMEGYMLGRATYMH